MQSKIAEVIYQLDSLSKLFPAKEQAYIIATV